MLTADLDSAYALGAEERDRFAANGFVRLAGVFDPAELAAYEPEITSIVLEINKQNVPLSQRSTALQRAFLRAPNVWQCSGAARQLVFAKRLARIAAELLGASSVRLYHDQALYKEPGGGATPWHLDQFAWPLPTGRACTIWIPLQDTPVEMGPLTFVVGSNRTAILGSDLPTSDESDTMLGDAIAAKRLSVAAEPFRLGDVSVHSGLTLHRAGANNSDDVRKVLTIIYLDAEAKVEQPTNLYQEKSLALMPGAEVGSVPDTALNPVLYRS
jgi:ectoine hydroxylase-related dioxygenase (phytanoyl-CoA dioxygenase family)